MFGIGAVVVRPRKEDDDRRGTALRRRVAIEEEMEEVGRVEGDCSASVEEALAADAGVARAKRGSVSFSTPGSGCMTC